MSEFTFKTTCPACAGYGGRCVGVTIGADLEQRLKELKELADAKCQLCGGTGRVTAALRQEKTDQPPSSAHAIQDAIGESTQTQKGQEIMTTIFKQVIEPNSSKNEAYAIEFEAPCGSRPISVAKQGSDTCVWFECNPDAKLTTIKIYCVGTGFGAVPERSRFIGTVVDGRYVWHFYTLIP